MRLFGCFFSRFDRIGLYALGGKTGKRDDVVPGCTPTSAETDIAKLSINWIAVPSR
jgi:hypothetical protein